MLSFPWIILETSTSKVHGSHTLMAVKNWLINTTISNIDMFLSLVALYTPTELTMDQPSSYTTWISPYMSTKQPSALRFRCSFWGGASPTVAFGLGETTLQLVRHKALRGATEGAYKNLVAGVDDWGYHHDFGTLQWCNDVCWFMLVYKPMNTRVTGCCKHS